MSHSQCESFDGMSNTRCCYHAGHSGDHLYSQQDESERIRWKIAADERDRLATRVSELEREVEIMRPVYEAAMSHDGGEQ